MPSALALECPRCGEVTPHRVLRGRLGGTRERVFEGVARCSRCSHTHSAVVREAQPRTVPLVVSWLGESHRRSTELGPDEVVEVGQRLETEEGDVEVTAIESKGQRVEASRSMDVDVLWARRIDKVRVRFTINRGSRTMAGDLVVDPSREFAIGEEVAVAGERILINTILRDTGGIMREGRATAAEIRRVYGSPLRPMERG